jgi:alkylation response protein AidB-like acyl-CoA dehydrogenase
MDIAAAEDQRLLQETTRRFLESKSPIGALRRLAGSGGGFDRDVWRQGAELGWLALFVPEDNGGMAESAQGVIDAAIVAEELGRVVFSGPFLPVSVVAFAVGQAGSAAQREALLPALAAGDEIAAWCFSAPGAANTVETVGVKARRDGDAFVLDGVAAFVEEAEAADHLLVTTADGEGLSQFLISKGTAGVTVSPLEALDLGRRFADVRFAGVRLSADALVGEAGGAGPLVERQLQLALALQSAESVGVADRAMEFTLEWVKQRVAFGRVIGSFQALKHRLADHATQLEGAKAAAAYAAQASQHQAPDAALAASVAKSQCGRTGTEVIRDCLQMHGGIGMTYDHDIHLYLRRAVSNEALLGTPAAHHERLARLAGL